MSIVEKQHMMGESMVLASTKANGVSSLAQLMMDLFDFGKSSLLLSPSTKS